MKVEVCSSSDGEPGFKITPENDSDKAILKIFDAQNLLKERRLFYSVSSENFNIIDVYIYGGTNETNRAV